MPAVISTRHGTRVIEGQLIRRGRSVETNLLDNRGSISGLEAGGSFDSMLPSISPEMKWP